MLSKLWDKIKRSAKEAIMFYINGFILSFTAIPLFLPAIVIALLIQTNFWYLILIIPYALLIPLLMTPLTNQITKMVTKSFNGDK